MLPAHRVIGHKEYGNRAPGGRPGRKSDPQYSMDWRRDRVANFVPRTTNGDDDMPIQELIDFRDDDGRNIFDKINDLHSSHLNKYDFTSHDVNPDDNTGHGLNTRREVAALRAEVAGLREEVVSAVKAAADQIRDDVRADLAAGYGLKLEPKDGGTPGS